MVWSATARLAQRASTHIRQMCGLPLDETTYSWEHWKVMGSAPNEGELYAGGVGAGTTMGSGFNIAVIDDYHRNVEDALSETIRKKQHEWFLTSCVTRMEPGASLLVTATRWHKDDLIGFILANAEQTGERWEVISMPAIGDQGSALWPERWPIETLEAKRRQYNLSGYPWMWEALYQQRPPEVLDSEWDSNYFTHAIWFDDWPADVRFRLVVLDPSVGHNEKADYSAIVVLAPSQNGHIYVDADIRRRDGYRQVLDVLAMSLEHHAITIGVEINGFQGVLRPMFEDKCRQAGYFPFIHGISSQQDKRMKIRAAITPFLSRGLLHFRRHSPGTALLMEQLRGFPSHRYDDGPDALAMALQLAHHIASYGVEEPREDWSELCTTI